MRTALTCFAALFCLATEDLTSLAAEPAADPLVVHEWGTFTELQNAAGISVGGVNTDDESVPDFVHRLAKNVLQSTNEPWRSQRLRLSKGVAWNADVTIRLETPVIYFYPPPGQQEPLRLDVDVQLRGGWLSEFYPQATANAPGLSRSQLSRHAVGTLQWHGLQVGVDSQVPETDDHVWTAPRKTKAARVATADGEAENFLFYRGVGSFCGPLRVETTGSDRLRLSSRLHTLGQDGELMLPAAWLVHVQPNGAVAFRDLGAFTVTGQQAQVIAEIDRTFEAPSFAPHNLARLRDEMHRALVEEGLFDDEATAMLATWDRAYFRSPGLRMFYLLPREWTDDRMPLTLSVPAQVERVMMGRIELITDRQQQLLAKIGQQPPRSRAWFEHIPPSAAREQFYAGDNRAAQELGVDVPADYQAYLDLGRFRNALLHDELSRTKNPHLAAFAAQYDLLPAATRAALSSQPVDLLKVGWVKE